MSDDIVKISSEITVQPLKQWNSTKPMIVYRNQRWVVHKDVATVVEAMNTFSGTVLEIASRASELGGEPISSERVLEIIDQYLLPNGMLDGTDPPRRLRSDRILWKLKFRLPDRIPVVERLLQPLMLKRWGIPLLILMLAIRGLSWSSLPWSKFIDLPTLVLTSPWVYVMVIFWFLTLMIHELGHVVAARMFHVRVPFFGFGFYWGSPVFFADLNDLWGVLPQKRIMVNLAGMYYQAACNSLLYMGSWLAGWTYGVWCGLAFDILLCANLNPLLKYDGYWVLNDLLDTYNLRSLKPVWPKRMRSRRDWLVFGYQIISWSYLVMILWLLVKGIYEIVGELWRLVNGYQTLVSPINVFSLILFLAGVLSLASIWFLRVFRAVRRSIAKLTKYVRKEPHRKCGM